MALRTYSLFELCEARPEEEIEAILSSFSCEKNADIQDFVRRKALPFNKRGVSSSYLVFDTEVSALVGFYALALKVASVPEENVSNSFRKKFEFFGEQNSVSGCIDVPSVLLAQLGKNDPYASLISGEQLIALAESTVRHVQRLAGGRFVFLDSADVPALLEFYRASGYREFGRRSCGNDVGPSDGGESFVQMFKYVHQYSEN